MKCPHCSRDISPNAKSCPHCGETDPFWGKIFTWLIGINIIFWGGLFLWNKIKTIPVGGITEWIFVALLLLVFFYVMRFFKKK